MNGKERATAAIARQPHDRIPVGLYAIDCDTAGRILGRETFIRNKPGVQLALWQGRRDEVAESLKRDVVELFRKLDIADIIAFKEPQVLPPRGEPAVMPKQLDDRTYEDAQGRIWQLSWESNDVCIVHDPRPKPAEYRVEEFPLPDLAQVKLPDASCYEVYDHAVSVLGGERYFLSPSAGLTIMPLMNGMEHGLMQWALCPDAVAACARRDTAIANHRDQVAIRPGTDGVMIESDMAGSNGLMISPRQWNEVCFPLLCERVASLKQRVPQVVLHCCGRSFDILDRIADAGVDCYQSLQTFAGMTVDRLLPEFGDRLAFWGGAPVELLVGGTPDEMRRAVRQTIDVARDYPGFIFGPSHSVAFGTKYDNFMAMLDEFARLA